MPGSELSWAGVFVPKPGEDFIFGQVIADGAIAHLAFALGGKPIGIDDLKFDRETYEKLLPQHPLYDGTNPDIAVFAARGGKLILWHGDSDPAGIDGALRVAAELRGDAVAQAIQLHMVYAPEPPFNSGTPETAPAAILSAARRAVADITTQREATLSPQNSVSRTTRWRGRSRG